MWLSLAVASGSDKASDERTQLARRMTGGQIDEAARRARQWIADRLPLDAQ
jgi:hypothetical protein